MVAANGTSERRWLCWLLVALAVPALTLNFTGYHHHHSSDTLIPTLVSVLHWRPFYWAQDRYGMLVPLLALPFRAPYANLMVQTFLAALSNFALFLLLARYLRVRGWQLAGLLSCAILLCEPDVVVFNITTMPYGISLTVVLCGLLLLEPGTAGPRSRRSWLLRAGAFALLGLAAQWVSPTGFVQLAPIIAFRELFTGRAQRGLAFGFGRAALICGWLAIAVGISLYASSRVDIEHTRNELLPTDQWWAGCQSLLSEFLRSSPNSPLLFTSVAVLLIAAVAGLAFKRSRGDTARALGFSVAVLFAAGLSWLLAAANLHVQQNAYSWRYVVGPLLLLAATPGIVGGSALWAWLPNLSVRVLPPVTAVVLLALSFRAFGPPTFSPMAGLQAKYGDTAQNLVESGCRTIAGEYWAVWPVVFEALQRQRDVGHQGFIIALSIRTQGVAELVAQLDLAKDCIGVPANHGRPPAIHYAPFPVLPATKAFPALTVYGPLQR